MRQDIAGARVLFGCGVPLVQLPCMGVVSAFCVTKGELEQWLRGTTPIGEYLADNTVRECERYAAGTAWSRCIWDVTAVGWLLNDGGRFTSCRRLSRNMTVITPLTTPAIPCATWTISTGMRS